MYNTCQDLRKTDCSDCTDQLEKLLGHSYCDHVRRTELFPGDGRLYVWYDERCIDSIRKLYRCNKSGSGSLLIFVLRFPSSSPIALRVSLRVESAPAQILQVEGGTEQNGIHVRSWATFVVPPLYPAAVRPCKQFVVPIQRRPGVASESGSLDVFARLKRDTLNFHNRAVNLPVIVPSIDERELLLGTDMDLITVVVAESIKLLTRDGWDFLKKQAQLFSATTDLIQLNLAGAVIPENKLDDTQVTGLVREAPLNLSKLQVNELAGLNTQAEHLSIKKKHLMSSRGYHPVQTAETKTEIEIIERDIDDLLLKIWRLLEGTGQVKMEKVKSAGNQ